MSFFTLSDNSSVNSSGNMEMGGGDIEPIPNNTQVKSAVEQAQWFTNKKGETVISLTWYIMAPKEHANRKVFQRIKVKDVDPKKRDKAILMLAAIDKNAGGKLFAKGGEPTDDDLMLCLLNKPMMLLLKIYEFESDEVDSSGAKVKKKGNWVAAVSPCNGAAPVVNKSLIDDDIAF